MKLLAKDAEQYYDLMWSLQHFANNKHQIIRGVKKVSDYATLSMEDKQDLRKTHRN